MRKKQLQVACIVLYYKQKKTSGQYSLYSKEEKAWL